MEPTTPHYLSLRLLKFSDVVKLIACMLFYDYFHLSYTITIPTVHYPIKSSYPNFELILEDLPPALVDVFFGIISRNL